MFYMFFIKVKKHDFYVFCLQINVFNIYAVFTHLLTFYLFFNTKTIYLAMSD